MKNLKKLALLLILVNSIYAVDKGPLEHTVKKISTPFTIDANWDKSVWNAIPPVLIENYMGDLPEHFPKVQAKLAYDDKAVYVIFKVNDNYVRAIADKTHGNVWEDSCVEFFFTPGTDLDYAYFNLETNCGGTMLFSWHEKPGKSQSVAVEDCDDITIAHSLPKIIDPEIQEPTTWTLEYRLPFELIQKYCPHAAKPAKGTVWRANIYKCGDETSHPHWLTWSYVDDPKPKFHTPEFFGTLKFE